MSRADKPVLVWGVWCLTCLLWSTVWLAIKIGVTTIPPFTVAYVRLLVAVIVLLPIAVATGHLRVQRQSDRLVLIGSGILLLGVNYALVFWGARVLPSGLVAVIQSATPLWGLAFAALVRL